MNFLQKIYLKSTRKNFHKFFRPLGCKKREKFFISPPNQLKDFFEVLPLLSALREIGRICLFFHKSFSEIFSIFDASFFEVIYYDKRPEVLSGECKRLKTQLIGEKFDYLIELNYPADLTLPYLVSAEKRISFYNPDYYPYYNILVRDGIKGILSFFQLQEREPKDYFKFSKSELKDISKKLLRQRPILFVNSDSEPKKEIWNNPLYKFNEGQLKIVDGLKVLYLCDAYYGKDDCFYAFAKIFKKQIVQ